MVLATFYYFSEIVHLHTLGTNILLISAFFQWRQQTSAKISTFTKITIKSEPIMVETWLTHQMIAFAIPLQNNKNLVYPYWTVICWRHQSFSTFSVFLGRKSLCLATEPIFFYLGKFVRDSKYNLQLSRNGPKKCIFSKIVADVSTLWDFLSDFFRDFSVSLGNFPTDRKMIFFGIKFAEGCICQTTIFE